MSVPISVNQIHDIYRSLFLCLLTNKCALINVDSQMDLTLCLFRTCCCASLQAGGRGFESQSSEPFFFPFLSSTSDKTDINF